MHILVTLLLLLTMFGALVLGCLLAQRAPAHRRRADVDDETR